MPRNDIAAIKTACRLPNWYGAISFDLRPATQCQQMVCCCLAGTSSSTKLC
jgi:hypothetical protein